MEGGDNVLTFRNGRASVQREARTAENPGKQVVQVGDDGTELGEQNGFFLPCRDGGAQFLKTEEFPERSGR